jgi:type VI secretion system protein ImpC
VSFAVVDVSIDRSVSSLARFGELAQAAEAGTLPIVAGTGEGLLGVGLSELEDLDNKMRVFEDKTQVPWQSAVAKPAALWVSLVANRVLSRVAYDKTTSRVKEAVIAEAPADANAHVFLSGPWVIGALAVQSFKDTQWPHRIVGAKAGVLGDLPVREIPVGESGENMAIPTEVYLTTETQRDAAKMGVLLLAAAQNSDAIYVHSAPTAYVPPPKRTYDNSTAEPEMRFERVSLVDQLFIARIAQFLRALCTRIAPGSDPGEVQPIVEAALWELLAGAPPGSIELDVKALPADGGSVQVTVRPRRFLGVAMEEVALEMPLGG